MSRIQTTFQNLKSTNQKALITYIVAGDPTTDTSLHYMHDLVAGGADIIELGMAFTDPMADGPTIQAAHLRALDSGITLQKTLDLVKLFRTKNKTTPIVLMGYANPIHAYGIDAFYKAAQESGVDGTLIVDVPPEEDHDWFAAATKNNIDFIRLATPTTSEDRLKIILNHAQGFLYYVSIAGITGTAQSNAETIKPHIDMIRSHTTIPLVIGFGIKNRNDAENMSAIADGIVVGSALIEAAQQGHSLKDSAKTYKV